MPCSRATCVSPSSHEKNTQILSHMHIMHTYCTVHTHTQHNTHPHTRSEWETQILTQMSATVRYAHKHTGIHTQSKHTRAVASVQQKLRYGNRTGVLTPVTIPSVDSIVHEFLLSQVHFFPSGTKVSQLQNPAIPNWRNCARANTHTHTHTQTVARPSTASHVPG